MKLYYYYYYFMFFLGGGGGIQDMDIIFLLHYCNFDYF